MLMKPNIKYSNKGSELEVVISGDFVECEEVVKVGSVKKVVVDLSSLGAWDTTLVVFLYGVMKKVKDVRLVKCPDGVQRLINLAFSVPEHKSFPSRGKPAYFVRVGQKTVNIYRSFLSGWGFICESAKSVGRFVRRKAIMRPIDFQFALEDAGYKALPIVALISFMVGLIVGFVGAMQLKLFGAEIFVASLVALAMVRIMGALMTGIIMSGRTGSAYAATIGTMQVNEEIDALKTMGVPVVDFLLLPRVMALTLMMPILTVFSDVMGIIGGAFVGVLMMDLPFSEYWNNTMSVLNMRHFLVGLTHGFVFGIIIAICGCYCGIKSGKDADSVGKAATSAVVYSIVWIIIATAVITIICQALEI